MSWISSISNAVEKALGTVRHPLKAIPPLLLICELHNRPGLSAIALTTAIIRRLSEAGICTTLNADGSPNKICQFVRIGCEEIVKEFQDNGVVDSVIETGAVITTGTGANAGGPVTVVSTNTMIGQLKGIIR